MKRFILLAAVLITSICIFAGCNSKDEPSSMVSESLKSIEEIQTLIEGETDAERIQSFLGYIKNEQLSEMLSDGVKLNLLERNGKLVYVIKDPDLAEDSIQRYQDFLKTEYTSSQYEAVANILLGMGIKRPFVVVEYVDNKGEVLATAEYRATDF